MSRSAESFFLHWGERESEGPSECLDVHKLLPHCSYAVYCGSNAGSRDVNLGAAGDFYQAHTRAILLQ